MVSDDILDMGLEVFLQEEIPAASIINIERYSFML